MGARPCVWVTRPAEQVEALSAELECQQFAVRHWPMLAIEEIDPLPGELRQRLLDLDRYEHLIFISANAARLGLARIADYWPQMPLGQHYWAVGASTARVLEAHGLNASFPDSDMSSEGLLRLPGLESLAGQRVLILRGEGGREFLAEALAARGAIVDALPCYRRTVVDYADGSCLACAQAETPLLILVSSGEGLARLSHLLRPLEHTNLAAITLVVPSPRVAEQAQALGWRHIECAENASDQAMLAAVARWRSAHLGEVQH